jgi:hypothetical protein
MSCELLFILMSERFPAPSSPFFSSSTGEKRVSQLRFCHSYRRLGGVERGDKKATFIIISEIKPLSLLSALSSHPVIALSHDTSSSVDLVYHLNC